LQATEWDERETAQINYLLIQCHNPPTNDDAFQRHNFRQARIAQLYAAVFGLCQSGSGALSRQARLKFSDSDHLGHEKSTHSSGRHLGQITENNVHTGIKQRQKKFRISGAPVEPYISRIITRCALPNRRQLDGKTSRGENFPSKRHPKPSAIRPICYRHGLRHSE
jgi:hypothetical protein